MSSFVKLLYHLFSSDVVPAIESNFADSNKTQMKKADSLGLTLGSLDTEDTKGAEREEKELKPKKRVCFREDINYFKIDEIKRNEVEVPLNKDCARFNSWRSKEFRTPNPKK